jgi:hypothetical protein
LLRHFRFSWAAFAALAPISCSDFRGSHEAAEGSPDAAVDVRAAPDALVPVARDAGGGVLPPGTGPGARGALPTGFCCERDEECRERHCVDVGGTKMCSDECVSPSICTNKHVQLECAKAADAGTFSRGQCMPPAGAPFACVAQSAFKVGARVLGDCCQSTGDGNTGWECEGALCVATGQNPWVCSHFCESAADCAGPYTCEPFGNYKMCVPANSPYACK